MPPPRETALLRVESATGLARGAAFDGATLDAATAADEAAALVDTLTDEGLVASTDPVIVRLAGAEMFLDRYPDAARNAERGLAAVLTGGSGHHLPILFWTGLVRTALGRLPEATALLDDAVEAARSANSQSVLGRVLYARSLAATACGDTDAALATAKESVAESGASQDDVRTACIGRARAWRRRGHMRRVGGAREGQ